MPSIDEQLATLSAKVTAIEGKADAVTAAAISRIQAVSDAYSGRIATLAAQFWVNALTGNDTTGDGSLAAPWATIKKAVDAVPMGARVIIWLMAAHEITQDIDCTGKHVTIRSSSATRHSITFQRYNTAVPQRAVRGFTLGLNSTLAFREVTITAPLLDGSWATNPAGSLAPAIRVSDGTLFGPKTVVFTLCDINFPATMFSNFIAGAQPTIYAVGSCTETGSTILGRMFTGVTNTSGTLVTTLPWLVTDLTNV